MKSMFPPTCMECGTKRTPSSVSYQPMQVVLGLPIGWWHVPKSEGQEPEDLCGPCMGEILASKTGGQR